MKQWETWFLAKDFKDLYDFVWNFVLVIKITNCDKTKQKLGNNSNERFGPILRIYNSLFIIPEYSTASILNLPKVWK